MLYTSVPKWEELTIVEKELYHEDKLRYNSTARKGGKTLYFARCGTTGETWVPLIEKAYAKLHGNYASISGGFSHEAVEDLTGHVGPGVSTAIINKDILDIDRFWNEELLKANQDRLFGCAFDSPDTNRSGLRNVKVDGLIGNHAYSVLRAVEVKGKRFVVLRNPWGSSEWSGRWSDGSKEWTPAWREILPLLNHEFGDDGQFVMEYTDFLDVWDEINRTILFDSSWIMSSQWLQVPVRPLPSAWSYGDVVFTFSLPKRTLTIVVLSQLDTRYFEEISGTSRWSLDFCLVKRGDSFPMAEASSPLLHARSVNLEMELDEGEYNVYVRLDRTNIKDLDYFYRGVKSGWDHRKLSRIMTERAKSRSIVSNFNPGLQQNYISEELTALLDRDKALYDKKKAELAEKEKPDGLETFTVTTVTTTTTTTKSLSKKKVDGPYSTPAVSTSVPSATESYKNKKHSPSSPAVQALIPQMLIPSPMPPPVVPPPIDACAVSPDHHDIRTSYGNHPPAVPRYTGSWPIPPGPASFENLQSSAEIVEDYEFIYTGLRVYTKDSTATVGGLLYHDFARRLASELDGLPRQRPGGWGVRISALLRAHLYPGRWATPAKWRGTK
ncbi:hypothetical protein DXG01_015373 [Tephrocybe rancida]|nr:hypothetical protein DXG01_015373 [Tephrocybe rancida]